VEDVGPLQEANLSLPFERVNWRPKNSTLGREDNSCLNFGNHRVAPVARLGFQSLLAAFLKPFFLMREMQEPKDSTTRLLSSV